MKYIDEVDITNRRILLRVDYNVSLNSDHSIANDERIKLSLPTIRYLLNKKNKLILVTHLGRPKEKEKSLSLQNIAKDLKRLLPEQDIRFIHNFERESNSFTVQNANTIILLENIRFFKEEEENSHEFAKKLASLADIYVNDAFSVSHRTCTSIVGITSLLPSFGGLLMKKELEMLNKIIRSPKSPFVAILGGSKISTKINLIAKLAETADSVLLGGGLANTCLAAMGIEVGKSLFEKEALPIAKKLLNNYAPKIILPHDVLVLDLPLQQNKKEGLNKQITALSPSDIIYDIGPTTQKLFAREIAKAQTIVWNGPVGYFEDSRFRKGTDAVFHSITSNHNAFSVVGGGDTLSAIGHHSSLTKIIHISTGGGAMLEYIENGTLPGIKALDNASTTI